MFRRDPNNFSVRIISSKSYVNFSFNNRRNLVARISTVSPDVVQKDKTRYESYQNLDQDLLEPRSWRDVCWEIGIPRSCKTLSGESRTSPKISLADFEDWLTVTTIIRPPQKMVRTKYGSLIEDQGLAGKVFLRGLELPSSSASGKSFRYAYDLLVGSTGRDRTSLSNANEESSIMAKIWRDAIDQTSTEEGRNQLLDQYLEMLDADQAADVHNASRYANIRTVATLWQHLRSKALAMSPTGFYHGPDKAEEVCYVWN